MDKAKRLEGVTYGVLERSCSRMMIGKVYWKTVALPSILHGSDVIDFIEKDVEKLQVIENNVYRKVLRAPSFTPIAVLRGEIGSSMMKTRIMNGRLMYWRGIFGRNNVLLRELICKPRC